MDVGFIGLGAMGRAMAANLVLAGHRVRAWNRSAGDAIGGVDRVGSPGEAFEGVDAIVTMLPDDPTIREAVLASGALNRAKKDAVHVVSSTISVAFADELAAAHASAGVGYVAAPVLGRPDVAAKGELNVLAAGDPAAVARVQPLLDAIGKRTWVMGADPRQANAAKIAANMMITMAIEAMAEGVAIADDSGLAPGPFLDVVLHTLFGGRAYESYSQNILKGQYEPGFKMRLGLKDLGLAAAAADAAGTTLPMLAAVHGQIRRAVDAGLGDKDWSAVADYTLHHQPE